jgi:hypothetical protein
MASYFNKMKRSSGLDFSDRGQLQFGPTPGSQGNICQWDSPAQSPTAKQDREEAFATPSADEHDRCHPEGAVQAQETHSTGGSVWMINEGGRRLFFFVWIFLHLLVFAFGFVHYQLNDNLTTPGHCSDTGSVRSFLFETRRGFY